MEKVSTIPILVLPPVLFTTADEYAGGCVMEEG